LHQADKKQSTPVIAIFFSQNKFFSQRRKHHAHCKSHAWPDATQSKRSHPDFDRFSVADGVRDKINRCGRSAKQRRTDLERSQHFQGLCDSDYGRGEVILRANVR